MSTRPRQLPLPLASTAGRPPAGAPAAAHKGRLAVAVAQTYPDFDLPTYAEIDAASFLAPWDLARFRRAFAKPGVFGLTAYDGADVVGYLVYSAQPEGARHAGRLYVHRFAVAPPYRTWGVGTQLMDVLKIRAAAAGVTQVDAVVRERNVSGAVVLGRLGFLAYGVGRGMFRGEGGEVEDGVKMFWSK